jgi:hypothetical protein
MNTGWIKVEFYGKAPGAEQFRRPTSEAEYIALVRQLADAFGLEFVDSVSALECEEPNADHRGRNTCGHRAPRVSLPPRCTECGKYAHGLDEPYKVHQPEGPVEIVAEPLLRWMATHSNPPQLEGRVMPNGN